MSGGEPEQGFCISFDIGIYRGDEGGGRGGVGSGPRDIPRYHGDHKRAGEMPGVVRLG